MSRCDTCEYNNCCTTDCFHCEMWSEEQRACKCVTNLHDAYEDCPNYKPMEVNDD